MGLKDIIKRQKNISTSLVCDASRQPFKAFNVSGAPCAAQFKLYRQLREDIPVIDSAVNKLVRLIGNFEVECDNKIAEDMMKNFFRTVSVGGNRNGLSAFISAYFENLLTYGTAVGEIVVSRSGDFYGLYNANLCDVILERSENGFDVDICDSTGTKVKNSQLVFMTALNPEPGMVYGTSLLKGLPFVSEILLNIFKTIGINWERVGNVRFAVTYKPQNDRGDRAFAKERAEQIACEWSKMQNSSAVRDFIAVGDVDVKVIGADNQILDSQVPVRQMLEQIVSKTGLPPFILGLSWSTTERMSAQQADILTSELEAYRKLLDPVIIRIAKAFLRLNGFSCEPRVTWDDIMLQDISQISQARLNDAQALRIETQLDKEEHDE
ncbi:MAG: serine/threonine protein phosphatase [Clostridia bacterium]|nr:serine/threonine protein phosphatase [Clostridia bacterium]